LSPGAKRGRALMRLLRGRKARLAALAGMRSATGGLPRLSHPWAWHPLFARRTKRFVRSAARALKRLVARRFCCRQRAIRRLLFFFPDKLWALGLSKLSGLPADLVSVRTGLSLVSVRSCATWAGVHLWGALASSNLGLSPRGLSKPLSLALARWLS